MTRSRCAPTPCATARTLAVACRLFGALCLWMLGYPDQARQWNEVALTQAQGLSHAYTLAQTLLFSSILHQWRAEASTAQEQVEALLALSSEHGFAMYLAVGHGPFGAGGRY